MTTGLTTEWRMIACPHCDGRGTLAQLDADLFIGCPACRATGELEVEAEREDERNHASDCATWVSETCDCVTGKRAL